MIGCQNGLTLRRLAPLLIVLNSKAPVKVPRIVPEAPNKLVPPITAEAMASSSFICPVVGAATLSREVMIRPATAAQTPEIK